MQELLALYSYGAMNATALEGAPPRRIGDYQKNTPCCQCLSEALMPGVLRVEDDFHGSGVNRIDLCLVLQNLKITPTIMEGTVPVPAYEF